MDTKHQLTDMVGNQLGWPDTEKKEKHSIIWQNSRKKAVGGLRLTEEGFRIFTEDMDMKNYTIDFPKDFTLTNQTTIWLDHFIDGPYYITKKAIIVFKEKTAVQLILFSGDVQKFGLAKAMSKSNQIA